MACRDARLLTEALAARGVPVELWGVGQAKTVAHLLAEVEAGETLLHDLADGRLLRIVSVVDIIVTYRGRRLVEDHQRFADGRVRRRNIPASLMEKVTPGENPLRAARRALAEELGINDRALAFTGHRKAQHSTMSPSYPGIATSYTTDTFDAELPTRHFKPGGYTERQADKQTVWVWEPADA